MQDDKNKNNDNDIFETEGIIIEDDQQQNANNTDTENLNEKTVKMELVDAIGIEISRSSDAPIEDVVISDEIKKELNDGGIELLPSEEKDNDTDYL